MNIAIVGGGASGLVCAITASQKSRELNKKTSITVYESKDRVGKKILATGNGRCNMLNVDKTPFYFSVNGFHKYATERFNASENLKFFEQMGLYTRTDEEGRVYPLSNQATTVLDFLRKECDLLGIKTVTNCEITKIEKKDNCFILNGELKYDKVVLACGGKAGVKSFNGYDILSMLNHPVTSIVPALTKINTANNSDVKQLQGIRHKAVLSLYSDNKLVAEEKGELLFAKYGISGIAVMQLSSFIARIKNKKSVYISADFITDFSVSELVEIIKKTRLHNTEVLSGDILSGFMPKKLSETVVKRAAVNPSSKAMMLSEKEIKSIALCAKNYKFIFDSLRSFEDAQVTAGGADTDCFNEKTMESKKIKGLYAVGELLNVDGLCGGYNLMWAWSSGRLCGENVIK